MVMGFTNEGNRHLVQSVKKGSLVYVHPESTMRCHGWGIVTEICLSDPEGYPAVVRVLHTNGEIAPADEFMISKVVV